MDTTDPNQKSPLPTAAEFILLSLINTNGGELLVPLTLAIYISEHSSKVIALDPDFVHPTKQRLITANLLRETIAHKAMLKERQAADNKRAQEARETYHSLTTNGVDPKIASALVNLVANGNTFGRDAIDKLMTKLVNNTK